MSRLISTFTMSLACLSLTAGQVFAQAAHSNAGGRGNGNAYGHDRGGVASVPEIDAASGVLALAAVVALIALFYELRRRRLAG